ncbi:putative short-chain dehydrogenase/reductase family 42E member 2 [Candoia aspera]|uniref:putative short-chain dehydrogenase/reductase family 42E member 2 n=1 Tax=Candoia aspera TaxID=51853 RepID=UPI002FD81118
MLHQHGDVIQRRSSESVLNRDKPPGCSFPRPMGLLGPKAMITGGAGSCGFYLCHALIKEGIHVVLLDIRKPTWEIPEGAVIFQADVQDYEKVLKASEGIDTIFHLASFGIRGVEQKEKIESTNVRGTEVIIDVCKSRNISKLIYTSTVNIVFGGIPIEDGDESLPYFPLEKHPDSYSRTKSVAEQMVLAANGHSLKGGGTLRTCALRFPGIYGPGQQKRLLHVLYEKLGYPKLRLFVPGFFLKITVTLMEYLHWLLKPIFDFTPFLTKLEVKHLLATHTFRIDKARNQLGYHPKKYSLTEMVDYLPKGLEEGYSCP